MCTRFVKSFADNVVENIEALQKFKDEHKKILRHVNVRFCNHPACERAELSTDDFHHNFWGDQLISCGMCKTYYCKDTHARQNLVMMPPRRYAATLTSMPENWDGGYICKNHRKIVLFRRFSL